jgi:hypothetical protein
MRQKAMSIGIALSIVAILIVATAAGVYLTLSHRSSATGSGASSSTQASSPTSSTVQLITASTTTQPSTTSYTSLKTTTSATAVGTITTTATTTAPTSSNTQTSCPTSTTTTTGNAKLPNIDRLFANFSSMTVEYKVTENSSTGSAKSVSWNSSYIVTSEPSINSVQYIVVSVNTSSGGSSQHLTIWYPPDGNATQVEANGYNITGTQATDFAIGYMSPFYAFISFQGTQLTALLGSNLKIVNQTSVVLGPTQMTVTTYEPQTLPLKVNYCSFSATFNSLVLQAGTVPGTSFDLLTYLYESGVFQSVSMTIFFKVLSVQKA